MTPARVEHEGRSKIVNTNKTKNCFGLKISVIGNGGALDTASVVMPDGAVASSPTDTDCCSLRRAGVHRTNVDRLDVDYGGVIVIINRKTYRVTVLDKDLNETDKEDYDAALEARGKYKY